MFSFESSRQRLGTKFRTTKLKRLIRIQFSLGAFLSDLAVADSTTTTSSKVRIARLSHSMSRGLIPSPLPVAYTDSREATERVSQQRRDIHCREGARRRCKQGDGESNDLKLSASPKFVFNSYQKLIKTRVHPSRASEGEIRRSGREI